MTFHNVRFPTDISYGSSGGPAFSTTITATFSGFEQRNINWAQARARYNVAYGVRTETQLAALVAFFRARQGMAYGFRYKDWVDYRSSADNSPSSPIDQLIGTGDGTSTSFALIKQYTSGAYHHYRPITKPVQNTVRIALLGTEITNGFTVNPLTGLITFSTPPAADIPITAGYEFDVPVRFDTDYLATSLDAFGLGSMQDVACVEIRE